MLTKELGYDKVKNKMKTKLTVICVFYIFFFLFCNLSFAFWIWTPETKRWINPKYAVKESPSEQLKFAQDFYNKGDFKVAMRELNKLISHYPRSREAAEAQLYIGLCLEGLDKSYEAYLAYQKVIDKYPFSERIEEVVERQFKIGERFLEGERRKVLGLSVPVENPAIEIFRKVTQNSPYGRYAPLAQYKLALCLKGLGRFAEAGEEFKKVISDYPESEWVEAAKFQIASCSSRATQGVDYDQEPIQTAVKEFEDFVELHPDAELTKEAKKRIEELRDTEAKNYFNVAQFYERQRDYQSAAIYYRYIIQNFPQSSLTGKAIERLAVIERK